MKAFAVSFLVLMLAQNLASGFTFASSDEAKSHFLRSVSLAEARNRGKVCEADAYASEVIKELAQAIQLDETYRGYARANRSLNRALHDNLAYQMLVKNVPVNEGSVESGKPSVLSKILAKGVTVYGAPVGVWGNSAMLTFGANGKAVLLELDMDATGDSHRPEYESIDAAYVVTRIEDAYLIQLSIPGQPVRPYRLGGDEKNGFVLFLDAMNPAPEAPLFTTSPSECSA